MTAIGRRYPEPANRWHQVFETIFLSLPEERSPGLRAIAAYLLRQLFLAPALVLFLFIVAVLVAASLGLVSSAKRNLGAPPGWEKICVGLCLAGQACFMEGLGRFSFIRRAEKPMNSIILFTAVTIIGPIIAWNALHLVAPIQICLELLASAALYVAVDLQNMDARAVVIIIMLIHTALLGLSYAFLL